MIDTSAVLFDLRGPPLALHACVATPKAAEAVEAIHEVAWLAAARLAVTWLTALPTRAWPVSQ